MIHSEKLLQATNYTLTVTTNPSSATCQLYYDGQWHTEKSCTVPAGTSVSYSLYSSSYPSATSGTGTVTMDKNKTLSATVSSSSSSSKTFNTSYYTNSGVTVSSSWYASGFSDSNYIRTSSYAGSLLDKSNWTFHVDYTCSNVATTTRQVVMGYSYIASHQYYHMLIFIFKSKIYFEICNTSTGAYYIAISTSTSDGWQTADIGYDGSSYFAKYNGSSVATKSSTGKVNIGNFPICIGSCNKTSNGSSSYSNLWPATDCTIDLNYTYIKSGSNYYYPVTTTTSYSYYWSKTVS